MKRISSILQVSIVIILGFALQVFLQQPALASAPIQTAKITHVTTGPDKHGYVYLKLDNHGDIEDKPACSNSQWTMGFDPNDVTGKELFKISLLAQITNSNITIKGGNDCLPETNLQRIDFLTIR
ncbi:MAG: hypothetical protein AAFW84_25235 [Cyanobacteria bacterium J06635_15]